MNISFDNKFEVKITTTSIISTETIEAFYYENFNEKLQEEMKNLWAENSFQKQVSDIIEKYGAEVSNEESEEYVWAIEDIAKLIDKKLKIEK